MPRDLLGDNLATLRIVENENDDENLTKEETRKFHCLKSRSFRLHTNPFIKDEASYCNYGINDVPATQYKTLSLPANSSIHSQEEEIITSALQLSAESIASQLTLLDLPCFKAIQPEELTSCGWNKRHKLTVAPNIVAFTKRFNQVIFWTVQEILNCSTPKSRSEIIAHFIKVAKKLQELNNLHSLYAIISALKSASIFRLEKTWTILGKKDKQQFDKISELFVENNNFAALRYYLKNAYLPCIPYLGLFLTDLVYIDMAHPQNASPHRIAKMSVVLQSLATFQQSDYQLCSHERIRNYLNSVRYIEELQKFLEDDHYKLSLRLEPPSPVSSTSSKESVWKDQGLSPSRRNSGSLRITSANFLPSHRKCHSLGSSVFGIPSSNPDEFVGKMSGSVNIMDDPVMEPPAIIIADTKSVENSISNVDASSDAYQGFVRRKTLLKDGRKPSMACWQRYWIQLSSCSLLYFHPKSFKGNNREDFKSEPYKIRPLDGWEAINNESDGADSFRLLNRNTSSLYKFKTDSKLAAITWIRKIQHLTSKPKEPLPANLMSFEL